MEKRISLELRFHNFPLRSFYRQIRLEMISLGREVRFGRSVVEEKVSEGFRFSV